MTTETIAEKGMAWIDAAKPRGLLDWRELWEHRELVYMLALRDLQVRYRQTWIGVAWVVLQPLAQVALFSVFFGLLGKRPTEAPEQYPAVVLSGLVIWQWFAQSVQQATASLVNNRHLITKIYFPRLALPLASIAAGLVDFAIGWACLLVMGLCLGVTPTVWWLASLPMALVVFALLTGIACWTSALNALYRDVGHMLPFVLQMGFFLSPVVYETTAVIPEKWRLAYALNPLSGAIEAFRTCWLGTPAPPWWSLAVSAAAGLCLLLSGLRFFPRAERDVADRV